MKRVVIVVLAIVLCGPSLCLGQAGGNVAYMQQSSGKERLKQLQRNTRVLTEFELPPTGTSMFLEANVLMNLKADAYVAVFAIVQEGETVADCQRRMDATIAEFSAALEALGIDEDDRFVDFVAQHRVYDFEVIGDLAREKLVGFELKKNLAIHFQDYALLDPMIEAAAESRIFDLVKVDYVVKDIKGLQDRLLKEAARIIDQKKSSYQTLLGIHLRPPTQVYAQRSAVHFPSELYDSYTAFEAEEMRGAFYRQRYTVQAERKSRTFFFNGLDADGFDNVINPIVIEPVVQATLYLKVKYEVDAEADQQPTEGS